MRAIIIILTIALFFLACNSSSHTKYSNFRDDTVRLKNGLGIIILEVPSRYDTILIWTNRSDCSSCGYEQYRFQRKNYPVFLESGFYWKGDPKDSVDEITIRQPIDSLPMDSIIRISESDHELYVEEYSKDPLYYPITRDTLINIKSKRYSVVFADHFDSTSMVFQQTLIAKCVVNGSDVEIKFRHWDKNSRSNSFSQECLYILNSVRFSNSHMGLMQPGPKIE